MNDFGKVRVYVCICGNLAVRPLHGDDPKACDHCGNAITGLPYVIEDHTRFMQSLIAKAKK